MFIRRFYLEYLPTSSLTLYKSLLKTEYRYSVFSKLLYNIKFSLVGQKEDITLSFIANICSTTL